MPGRGIGRARRRCSDVGKGRAAAAQCRLIKEAVGQRRRLHAHQFRPAPALGHLINRVDKKKERESHGAVNINPQTAECLQDDGDTQESVLQTVAHQLGICAPHEQE